MKSMEDKEKVSAYSPNDPKSVQYTGLEATVLMTSQA